MLLDKHPAIARILSNFDGGMQAAIVCSRNHGIVREWSKSIASQVTADPDDPFNTATLYEPDIEANADRLDGELRAVSMLGGKRLVRLVLGSEEPLDKRRRILDSVEESLSQHLNNELNPEAFFLIETTDLNAKHKLLKVGQAASKCCVLVGYDDEAGELAGFTREALAKDGLSLTRDALDLFVARLPHERGVARSEIERLALYLSPGSGAVGKADDLTDFFGVEPEASLQAAALDAFGGRLAAAQAGLRRAAQEGESGFAAIRALGIHLGTLRKIATMQKSGATAQSAAKSARVFWKSEAEVLRQARAWTLPEVDGVQPEILSADIACKQAGAPDHLLAERLALTVAGRARRLGL